MKRFLFAILLMFVLVGAKPAKFSFEDVLFPDGQVGELEATSKSRHTTCRYFADNYLEYLGQYDAHEETSNVLQFCLDHYEDRVDG